MAGQVCLLWPERLQIEQERMVREWIREFSVYLFVFVLSPETRVSNLGIRVLCVDLDLLDLVDLLARNKSTGLLGL
jgi:hypothetical protein